MEPETYIGEPISADKLDAMKDVDYRDEKEVIYKKDIRGFNQYILRVDILVPNGVKEDKKIKETIDSVKALLPKDVPCNLVNRFVSYEIIKEDPTKAGIINI